MIERAVYDCDYCGKKFKSGDWFGCEGDRFRRHLVKPKQYQSKNPGHIITIPSMKERVIANPSTGESQRVPGFSAIFANGIFKTNDPEVQEHLNKLEAEGSLVSMEVYINSKLTPEQIAARAQTQLAEKTALLEKTEEEFKRLREENEKLKAGPRGMPFPKKDRGAEGQDQAGT